MSILIDELHDTEAVGNVIDSAFADLLHVVYIVGATRYIREVQFAGVDFLDREGGAEVRYFQKPFGEQAESNYVWKIDKWC